MGNSFRQGQLIERRALVALACVFLLVQSFLSALATGYAGGQYAPDDAFAILCSGQQVPGEAGQAPADRPHHPMCTLCPAGAGGAALVSADVALAQPVGVLTGEPALEPVAFRPFHFHAPAGLPRAPPALA